jgi:DNA polymerase-3 subunit delta'
VPLSDVVHQDVAHKRLQRALASDRVSHAYLFSGPPGIGKGMLAERFAARLLCTSPRRIKTGKTDGTDACGECTECVLFAAGNHPDSHRIHRRLNKFHPDKQLQNRKALDLSVDVIRHFLIGEMGKRPARGIAKVYVVVDAERMSTQAQNALLKSLEEPPEQSYLILLVSSADALLPTTRSRCQQIPFRGLPSQYVVARLLEHHGATADAARFLSELTQGSLGIAIRHFQAGVFDRVPELLEAAQSAAADPLSAGRTLAEIAKELSSSKDEDDDAEDSEASAARRAQLLVIAMTATILRDIQRVAVGYEVAALPKNQVVQELATRRYALDHRGDRAAGTAEYQIGRNANTGLVFDALGISLGRTFSRGAVATGA